MVDPSRTSDAMSADCCVLGFIYIDKTRETETANEA